MNRSFFKSEARRYWLRLVHIKKREDEKERVALAKEATELMKIFGAILEKSK